MNTERLKYWISERYAIYKQKVAGEPKPWTQDPILQKYSFCNVHRENDKITKWIRMWAAPRTNEPYLWFAFVVARLINWPDTLGQMKFPIPWNAQNFADTIHDIQHKGQKAYGGAYIVSTNGRKMDKADYLAAQVLQPLWNDRKLVTPIKGDACEALYARLRDFQGMGTFIAAQVVADTKHHGYLAEASDKYRFCAPGPGSLRGMNRVLGNDKDAPMKEHTFVRLIHQLQDEITPWAVKNNIPTIDAQDLQNCLCEYDKYERARLNEGTPRSTYPGVQ